MTYLDEDIKIRLNNLYPNESGQYYYTVKKDGVLVFSGYTYLEAGDYRKDFDITDICAHYRYDGRDFFEYTASYNVDVKIFSTYTVTVHIDNKEVSASEEVAHIFRYPTNTSDTYHINKDFFNYSYMPLLQSTKVKSVFSLSGEDVALFETTFLPHYPKVDTTEYGVGVMLVSENEEVPVMLPNGETTTIPNNSYLPLSELYFLGNNLDVSLGGFTYNRYNLKIDNITYNVAVPP